MLVTVVMGVYNPKCQQELRQAVYSILNQTLKEIEFIICDDGSNEETKEQLLLFAKKDKRVRILNHQNNGGLAAALNACIGQAKGKYIARMDADDVSKPNRLKIQYDFLEENEKYAFVGSNAELIDSNGMWGIRKMPEHPKDKDFLPYSPFIHPSVMVRKRSYQDCGGYQEGKATWRSEDYEIFMRMYGLGIRGYNLQENLLQYREDENSYQKRKYQYRIEEAKIRYRYFKELKVPWISRITYTLKPLIVGLIPIVIVKKLKCIQAQNEVKHEQREGYEGVQENFEPEAVIVANRQRSAKAM